MIVLPWDGQRTGTSDRFSHTADTLLDLANTPVIVARMRDLSSYRTVVLRLDTEDLCDPHLKTAELVWLVGARLSGVLKSPLVLATSATPRVLEGAPGITGHVDRIEQPEGFELHRPLATDELVIRPFRHQGSDPSTLWVALPRSAPTTSQGEVANQFADGGR